MSDYTRWLNAANTSRDQEQFAAMSNGLHHIARARMAGERPGQTLNATGIG